MNLEINNTPNQNQEDIPCFPTKLALRIGCDGLEISYNHQTYLVPQPDVCRKSLNGLCSNSSWCEKRHFEIGQNIKDFVDTVSDVTCGICHEGILEQDRRFGVLADCGHHFCLSCISSFSDESNSCPTCKAAITTIQSADRPIISPKSSEAVSERRRMIEKAKRRLNIGREKRIIR